MKREREMMMKKKKCDRRSVQAASRRLSLISDQGGKKNKKNKDDNDNDNDNDNNIFNKKKRKIQVLFF